MTLLLSVARELFGMFVADLRLTIGILLLVALVAFLTAETALPALVDGGALLAGSLAILLEATLRQARLMRRDDRD